MLPHTGLFLLWKVALQMRIRRRLKHRSMFQTTFCCHECLDLLTFAIIMRVWIDRLRSSENIVFTNRRTPETLTMHILTFSVHY